METGCKQLASGMWLIKLRKDSRCKACTIHHDANHAFESSKKFEGRTGEYVRGVSDKPSRAGSHER